MGLLIPPASIYSNSMHVHDRSDLHAVMQLSNPQVGAIMQQIREKESQLETLSAELAAAEQSLRTWQQHQANRRSKESFPEPAGPLALEDLQQSIKAEYTASSASMLHPIAASTMIELQGSTLAAQRSEVLLRWQCLLEDKKQLRLMMAAAKGEPCAAEVPPFSSNITMRGWHMPTQN